MILRLGNQGQVREQTVIATNERRQSNGGGSVVLNRMAFPICMKWRLAISKLLLGLAETVR